MVGRWYSSGPLLLWLFSMDALGFFVVEDFLVAFVVFACAGWNLKLVAGDACAAFDGVASSATGNKFCVAETSTTPVVLVLVGNIVSFVFPSLHVPRSWKVF